MKTWLALLVIVLAVVVGSLTLVSAGDILPGGNGGLPGWTAVAGDIGPGENGLAPAFHVAGDIGPGENG